MTFGGSVWYAYRCTGLPIQQHRLARNNTHYSFIDSVSVSVLLHKREHQYNII